MNISLSVPINRLIFKINLIILGIVCHDYVALTQEVKITCTNKPLNEILISLRDNYSLMISFNDKELSNYKLTLDKEFVSIPQALNYLLTGLPLAYEVSENVYIIYSKPAGKATNKFIIAGRIFDKTNLETLPFSSIVINNSGSISDVKGNFSYTSSTDSIFNVKISYLGYYILDTIIPPGANYVFRLIPSVIALEEIVVEGSEIARSIETGNTPGTSRINHKIAYLLPGNGDNSTFNLLRLQPGILAAGEQSTDLIIWGSYEGHSQVIFDGFTIYGMKNFNDNISAVNPYMAKDIKILKGGFGAEYGERVGGIVDITGIEGNRLSPSAQLSINNTTLNGLLSVPLFKKSALVMAYRQTYYDLYNPIEIANSRSGRGRQNGGPDYYASPDYQFRDLNLKYSGSSNNSNYYISFYGGRDNYDLSFNDENQNTSISSDYSERNNQLGAAVFYGYTWKERNTSNVTISYSSLETDKNQEQEVERTMGNQPFYNSYQKFNSAINEINARINHNTALSEMHDPEAGAGLLYYFGNLQETYSSDTTSKENSSLPIPYFYLQDNITLFKNLQLKPGVRVNWHTVSNKFYFQPRFAVLYKFREFFRINTSWGLYNQFISKNIRIDELGNYQSNWSVSNNDDIPVLHANTFVFGCSFTKNNFTVNVEGYLKFTGGIKRYLQTTDRIIPYEGKGKTKGIDFFIKKEFKHQSLWIAYTLSKTEEYFPYFPSDEYLPALHDQRHEIKLAGLIKLKPFYLSANYVFGSGFPDPELLHDIVGYIQSYNRLDAAFIYKFSIRKIYINAGISVLNLLNTENIRYSNFTTIPTDESSSVSVYAEPVPFTPSLFLNLRF